MFVSMINVVRPLAIDISNCIAWLPLSCTVGSCRPTSASNPLWEAGNDLFGNLVTTLQMMTIWTKKFDVAAYNWKKCELPSYTKYTSEVKSVGLKFEYSLLDIFINNNCIYTRGNYSRYYPARVHQFLFSHYNICFFNRVFIIFKMIIV